MTSSLKSKNYCHNFLEHRYQRFFQNWKYYVIFSYYVMDNWKPNFWILWPLFSKAWWILSRFRYGYSILKSSNVTILSFSLCIRIIDVCFSWHMRRAKMKNKVLDVGQDSPDGLDLSILIFDNLRWKSSPTITSFRNTLQKSTCRYFHFVNQDMHGFFPFKYWKNK